ncbi:MAG: terminase small subunit [Oscillospiraceae bacterium]
MERKLQEREKRFVREWLVDGNQTQAAIRAGYAAGRNNGTAATTATRLMKRPEVAAYRDILVREQMAALGITRENIGLQLWQVFCRCMEKTPVLEWDSDTSTWKPSGTWKFDAKGALRALDQLAGLQGLKKDEDGGKETETVEQYLSRTGGEDRSY